MSSIRGTLNVIRGKLKEIRGNLNVNVKKWNNINEITPARKRQYSRSIICLQTITKGIQKA